MIAVSINYLCVLRFNPCCFSSLICIIHSGSFTLWLPSRCDQKKELVKKKKNWGARTGKRNQGILINPFTSLDVSDGSYVSSMVPALTGFWAVVTALPIVFPIPKGSRNTLLLLTHGLSYPIWLLNPSVTQFPPIPPYHNSHCFKDLVQLLILSIGFCYGMKYMIHSYYLQGRYNLDKE